MKVIKSFFVAALALLVIVFVVSAIGGNNQPAANQPNNQTEPAGAAQAIQQTAAPAVPVPPMEAKIISIVNDYAAKYDAAPNQMAQGALRPARAREICHVMAALNGAADPFQLNNWVGIVQTLSSNNDGKGVLAIAISGNTIFTTWNNDLSDIGDNTLIQPGTALLTKASALSVGQQVYFSGRVFVNKKDCLEEQSLTMDGAMKNPAFTFKFTDVRPVSAN
ncbi:hypothetical protein [Acidocella sp.]|uniref:hypothetical protein n=1 Tax=Acidocella sp. TaxID=50710 RepID=UPI0026263075|nr:hypothetical protein [Acidocella sp.]MDD2794384.1 hypothetical protein [Acidocella sp.]